MATASASLLAPPSLCEEAEEATVFGYSADPAHRETWDDDFDGTLKNGAHVPVKPLAMADVALDEHNAPNSRDPLAVIGAIRSSMLRSHVPPHHIQDAAADVEDNDSDGSDAKWSAASEAGPASIASRPNSGRASGNASSEEEDWDLEIAMEDVEEHHQHRTEDLSQRPSAEISEDETGGVQATLRAYLRSKDESATNQSTADVVPRKYRLLELLEESEAVRIVKYPKPSTFYSITTPEGRSSFRERVLEQWLNQLVIKYARSYVISSGSANPDLHATTSSDAAGDSSSLSTSRLGGTIIAVHKLPPAPVPDTSKGVVSMGNAVRILLSVLLQTSADPRVKQASWLGLCAERIYGLYRFRTKWSLERAWSMLTETISVLIDLSLEPLLLRDVVAEDSCFDLVNLILYIGAKLSHEFKHSDRSGEFYGLVDVCMSAFPNHRDQLELLLLSALAHFDGSQANIVLRSLVALYSANRSAATTRQAHVAAEALTSLHLYLSNYSPLNTSVLADSSAWELDDDPSLSWLEHALNDHEPTHEILLKQREEQQIEQHTTLEDEKLLWLLCGRPQARMERLEQLHVLITSHSFLRARCSYVMGHYFLHHHHDTTSAERLLFECIYLLDGLEPRLPGRRCVPLISEMGTNALVAYGDILLSNGKYRYAILALEAASTSHRFRGKGEFHAMDRRLCDVCSENQDWARALRYHVRLLEAHYVERNIPEYVYLAQQIAKIHLERGDFFAAECQLISALLLIRSPTRLLETDVDSPEIVLDSTSTVESPRRTVMLGRTERANSFISSNDYQLQAKVTIAPVTSPHHNASPSSVQELLGINLQFEENDPEYTMHQASCALSEPITPNDSLPARVAGPAGSAARRDRQVRTWTRLRTIPNDQHQIPNFLAPETDRSDSPVDQDSTNPHRPVAHVTATRRNDEAKAALQSKYRSARLTLYLRLAQLYSDGGRLEDAVRLLGAVLTSDLPRGKAPLVKLRLVKTLVKLRQLHRASQLIREMEARADGMAAKSNSNSGLVVSYAQVVGSHEFIELRAAMHLHQGAYQSALYWADNVLRLQSLGASQSAGGEHMQKARGFALKGKVLHAIASKQIEQPSENETMSLPDMRECIDAFSQAYELFTRADDSWRCAKVLVRICEAYLQVLVSWTAVHPFSLEHRDMRLWLEQNGFAPRRFTDLSSSEAARACLERLEHPTRTAADLMANLLEPLWWLRAMLNLAELKFVQRDFSQCVVLFEHVHRAYVSLLGGLVTDPRVHLNYDDVGLGFKSVQFNLREEVRLSPGFKERVTIVTMRMVRLLAAMSRKLPRLVADHTHLLDSYLLYRVDLEQQRHDRGNAVVSPSPSSSGLYKSNDVTPRSDTPSTTRPNVSLSPTRESSKMSQSDQGSRRTQLFANTRRMFRGNNKNKDDDRVTHCHGYIPPLTTPESYASSIDVSLGFSLWETADPMALQVVEPRFIDILVSEDGSFIGLAAAPIAVKDQRAILHARALALLYQLKRNCARLCTSRFVLADHSLSNQQVLRRLVYTINQIRVLAPLSALSDESTNSVSPRTVTPLMNRFSLSHVEMVHQYSQSYARINNAAQWAQQRRLCEQHGLWSNLVYIVAVDGIVLLHSPIAGVTLVERHLAQPNFINDVFNELQARAKLQIDPESSINNDDDDDADDADAVLDARRLAMQFDGDPACFRIIHASMRPTRMSLLGMRCLVERLDPQHILAIFSCLLNEHRIVFLSSSQTRLSMSMHALVSLMYPLTWPHMFCPLLAQRAFDFLLMQRPYLFGVRAALRHLLPKLPPDVVVVQLDRNRVYIPPTIVALPCKLHSSLYKALVKFLSCLFLMRTESKGGPIAKTFPAQRLNNVLTRRPSIPRHLRDENGADQQTVIEPSLVQQHHLSSGVLSQHDRSISADLCSMPSSTVVPQHQIEMDETEGQQALYLSLIDSSLNAQRIGLILPTYHRMSRITDDADVFASLAALRRSFAASMAALLFRYRLFFDENAKPPCNVQALIDYSMSSSQTAYSSLTFLRVVVHSRAFSLFTAIRAAARGAHDELFEQLVDQCLYSSAMRLNALNNETRTGYVHVRCMAIKPKWKKRWLSLEQRRLCVCKSKRQRSALKMDIILDASSYRLSAPPTANLWSLSPINVHRDDNELSQTTIEFRGEDMTQANAWFRLIAARLTPQQVLQRYENVSIDVSRQPSIHSSD